MLSTSGPFRINAPVAASGRNAPTVAAPGAATATPAAATAAGDEYLQRLVKLVPSEVLALYLTFKEIADAWLGIWATICLVLVVFVRTIGTLKAGKSIQLGSVGVATISFVLWVYATGGYFLQIKLPADIPGIVSVSVGVWTFLVPYFYTGD